MATLLLALIYLTAADTLTGKVVRIADGDTVTILVGGNQVRVRLFGIDAPERGQDYSRKSSEALADLVFGKEVRVVVQTRIATAGRLETFMLATRSSTKRW